jgi:hypothetical protein
MRETRLRLSLKGWQKIAGGKHRAAAGTGPQTSINPEGVADNAEQHERLSSDIVTRERNRLL